MMGRYRIELLVPGTGQEFFPVAQVPENKDSTCPLTVTPNPEYGLGRSPDSDHFGKVSLAAQLLCGGSSSGSE